MIQRIHVDNPHVRQEPPGAFGQVLLQLVVKRREESRHCRIVWEWIEGRGDGAEVQSARAYTDTQRLTTGNASPPERAAEPRVIPAELEDGCPNRASVYWQQTSPCEQAVIIILTNSLNELHSGRWGRGVWS